MLIERPLLQALTQARSPVLLIDELDRADEPFDAFLLEVLAENQLTIPELGTVKAAPARRRSSSSPATARARSTTRSSAAASITGSTIPTSSASSRSCACRAPGASERLAAQVVAFVQRMRTLDLFKAPGIAETIDWTQRAGRAERDQPRPRQRSRHARRAAQAPRRHRQDAERRRQPSCSPSCRRRAARPGSAARRRPMLADNVVHFARVLRHAGLAVGPDRVLAALEAIEAVGLARRDDVHAALSAVMIDRHEQQALFDDAFDAFWRDPKLLERMMAELLPKISGRGDRAQQAARQPPRRRARAGAARRCRAAGARGPTRRSSSRPASPSPTASACSAPTSRSMTAAEFELAKKLAEEVPLPFAPVRRRRHEASARGRIDLRATMLRDGAPAARRWCRASAGRGASCRRSSSCSTSPARWTATRGCMLHYVHGLTRRYLKVHTLTFGTRLTNITRALRHRDPDLALELASAQVQDWKGGTRIASCLDDFNRHWARRLLGANAALLLVTDGLDRDEHGELTRAAQQLRLFARQIVWLNPLLRFDALRAARRRRARAAAVRRPLPAGPQPGEPRRPGDGAAIGAACAPVGESNDGTERRTTHPGVGRRDLGRAQRSRRR